MKKGKELKIPEGREGSGIRFADSDDLSLAKGSLSFLKQIFIYYK